MAPALTPSSPMKRLCVYCGSSRGNDPVYAAAATELAQVMAEKGINLVYGGGRIGLMGVLADYPIALAPAMGHNFYFAYGVRHSRLRG